MNKRFYVMGIASCLFVLASVVGCGNSGQPTSVSQDELSAFLDENPELNKPTEFDVMDDIRSAYETQ